MILRRTLLLAVVSVAVLGACGFHPRREAQLPAAMQRIHVEIADASGPLARGLARALERSGVELVATSASGAAVLGIPVNTFTTDVLSVGGNARATEYSLRYHVEFQMQDAAGASLIPRQTIELSREFTFDASQALGVAAQTDLLTDELQRDMVQAILRRVEARSKSPG